MNILFFPSFNSVLLQAWDHAVGMLCVHEAGGKVRVFLLDNMVKCHCNMVYCLQFEPFTFIVLLELHITDHNHTWEQVDEI